MANELDQKREKACVSKPYDHAISLKTNILRPLMDIDFDGQVWNIGKPYTGWLHKPLGTYMTDKILHNPISRFALPQS